MKKVSLGASLVYTQVVGAILISSLFTHSLTFVIVQELATELEDTKNALQLLKKRQAAHLKVNYNFPANAQEGQLKNCNEYWSLYNWIARFLWSAVKPFEDTVALTVAVYLAKISNKSFFV